MAKIFIDGSGTQMGRLGSFVAKQALSDNEVTVLNCEKVIISGRKEEIIKDFKDRRRLNTINPTKGPFFSRIPEKIMKRAIRGMLPDYRLGRGKVAWKKIRCYAGVPEEFSKEKLIKIPTKLSSTKSITLEELNMKA